jgi:hypothetical protein
MLRGLFRQVPTSDSEVTFMPFVRACVIRSANTSIEVDALLDSGSAFNLIPLSSLKTLLGLSQDEARKGRQIAITGVGQSSSPAYGWQVDFRLRATTNSTDHFLWKRVWMYVCEATLPIGQILIGQSYGLEEKVFVHLNRSQKRYWQVTG